MYAHKIYDGTSGGYDKGSLAKGAALTRTFSVTAGQKVRVALTWDSHTAGADNYSLTDTLTADLDLSVTYPGGFVRSMTYDPATLAFTLDAS